MTAQHHRIIEIQLDAQNQPRLSADHEQERSVAIFDLIEENYFALIAPDSHPDSHPDAYMGPYILGLNSDARHIHFEIRDSTNQPRANFLLAMGPLRRVMRDYQMVCDSYYQAIRTKTPSQIQAIDMGRRALHDEGAQILQQRLEGKIKMDHPTARRLFSLVFVLKQGTRL